MSGVKEGTMPELTVAAPQRTEARLAPLYDAALSLVTREGRWRRALAAQVSPRAGDVIAELGSGSGALAVELAQAAPGARIIAIDSDAGLIARGRQRAKEAGVDVEFAQGLSRDAARLLADWAPNKIVASFAHRAIPMPEKRALIAAAHDALRADGRLHLADFGPQRTLLMRRLMRAAQRLHIVDNFPDATPALIAAMRAAGFVAVEETESFPTPTGSISLFRGRVS